MKQINSYLYDLILIVHRYAFHEAIDLRKPIHIMT